jgi:hypothetical protein
VQQLGPWVVRIEGVRPVLERLRDHLTAADLGIVELDGVFHLKSPRLAGLTEPDEIDRLARDMCQELEIAVLAATGFDTDINVKGFGHERSDGSAPMQYVNVQTISAGSYLIAPSSAPPAAPPTESPEDRAFRLNRAHPNLAQAFRFLSGEPDWYRLYKAFELVRAANGKRVGLAQAGWASEAQQGRFTHTADSAAVLGDDARHADVKGRHPPSNPMTLGEAQVFVADLVRRWSDSLP